MPETYWKQEKVVFCKKDNFFVFFEKETQSAMDAVVEAQDNIAREGISYYTDRRKIRKED